MWWIALIACTEPGPLDTDPVLRCNGSEEACGLRVDQITVAGTHNAMSSEEREWLAPNQGFAVPRQFADGVRGINLDTHEWEGELFLCHGFCDLGSQPLVEGFAEITLFLEMNPDEVVLVTLQSGISEADTVAAGDAAGWRSLTYTHTAGEAWPTLGELIEADTRLLVFGSGGERDWLMAQWTHWIDNPYSAETIEDFSCEEDRGEAATATLFNVNHFLTAPIALRSLAEQANAHDVLVAHVLDCQEQTGRRPNQVLVDFYDEGAVLEVVEEL